MVLVANAGLRTRAGTLAHYLSAACPLARSAYFEPERERGARHSASTHALRRERDAPPPPPPCDCLPTEPIPPPEHFDF
ncbi:uncharacterized protein LOC119836084 [Zerene cesonia]|uniref:uncharacterized protein LOC119836084 n=1 Tax=Zerene cesonia TaxID=33412 RepID=UPI0018E51F9A|nr:uncharacterized protein LOC119836084 [Zerene cesonia]